MRWPGGLLSRAPCLEGAGSGAAAAWCVPLPTRARCPAPTREPARPPALRPQDPERQGPPSRQGSALVNGINWSDRRSGAPGGPGGAPSSSAFARSRSMPHGPQPDAGLYHDRSASLSQFLGGE